MEKQVFTALHSAPSNEEIAADLNISTRTVKFHIANIRAKLGGLTRLRLCLLSALHHRGLPALCTSCAQTFAKLPKCSTSAFNLSDASAL
ncbi:LuxR C-terminal-related transcriptional regulator [Streptomyces sp. ISL-100]|uniref:LuxR C-terminal-related transcriptional regulator n=1 Tax=Streptomyces sp. ISL-100 TaxID=2819173 RepID=UPI001BE54D58|nr:LuxR C-terminal-related transcriptional regulator [Streptomyces sp. ISL-100]MBT2397061.1 hypothetical protein [Streptomyces sp. ISL-100]